MPINFDELTLRSVSYEIRYENAYLLWDRAGAIAVQLASEYPELRNTQATPGNIAFNLGRNFGISIGIDKTVVSGFRIAKEVEQYIAISQSVTDAVVEILDISALSRIGLRPVFSKPFPTKETAGDAAIASGLLKATNKKLFNVDIGDSYRQGEYVYRRESENLGFMVHIAALGQKTEFKANIDLDPADVPDVSVEKHSLAVDIDYYTTAMTPIRVFRATDWLSQALHTINRDARIFLGDA